MSPRTQTLVQLNEELVEALDRRAARDGVSRSELIHELLGAGLRDDRRAATSRQMIDGYARHPQSGGRDAWGDLDAWTAANARRNLAALGDEEDRDR